MFWIVLASSCWLASAAKLSNEYLPPPPAGAKLAGGTDYDLEVPLEPPYIDPYTDPSAGNLNTIQNTRNLNRNQEDVPDYEPNSVESEYSSRSNQGRNYGRNHDSDQSRPVYRQSGRASGVNNIQYNPYPETNNPGYIENSDQIRKVRPSSLAKSGGKFISGSYSYKGPDNVLVTVTYTADDEDQKNKASRSYVNDKGNRKPNLYEVDENQGGRRQFSRQYPVQSHQQHNQFDQDEDQVRTSRRYPGTKTPNQSGESIVPTPASLPSELERAFDFHKNKHQDKDAGKDGYQYEKPPHQAGRNDGKPEIDQGYSYPKPQQSS